MDMMSEATKVEPSERGKRDFDPGAFREALDALGEKIPALLRGLTETIHGKDEALKFRSAAGNFYRTLKGSGMTDEQAFRLTEQYTSSLNFGGRIAEALAHRREGEGWCPATGPASPSP